MEQLKKLRILEADVHKDLNTFNVSAEWQNQQLNLSRAQKNVVENGRSFVNILNYWMLFAIMTVHR